MLNQLAYLVGRIVVPLFEGLSSNSWRSLPLPPPGRTVTRGPGHDPDRVLLLGGGSAVGWGVVSHDLALAGHLARGTSALTERGVDVEVEANPRMSVADAIGLLRPAMISRYDAIVVTLGSRDAQRLIPVARWESDLTQLLDHIADGRAASPGVIIVGAEEQEPVPVAAFAARLVRARARDINAATRAIVAGREGVWFVESGLVSVPGESANLVEVDKATLYERAAVAIIPTLARALEQADHRVPLPLNEDIRGQAVEFLRARLQHRQERVSQLLETVMHVLHVRSSHLFFVDRDEVFLVAGTGASPTSRARDQTLSNTAIEHRTGLVIPDLAADPEHRTRPEVVGPPHLRFYASYPVESPDGARVAVLTVVDTQPREMSASELGLLRHFALRMGALLFDGYRPTP